MPSIQDLCHRFIASGNELSSIQDDVLDLNTNDFFKLLKLIDAEQARLRGKTYQYLVTFTVDPTKHPEIPEDKIETYIESQADRPALCVTHLSYVKEKHKNGRFHWHAKFITTRAIRSDAFTQYNKIYGKTDISRSKHTNGQHCDIYMNKEGTIKTIKG